MLRKIRTKDRIDIHIEVPSVDYEKLSGDRLGETSKAIRARVQTARDIQNKRFSNNGLSDIVCNAYMRVGEIRQFCKLQDEGGVLTTAGSVEASEFDAGGNIVLCMSQMNLSARAYHRIQSVKLACTIAGLAGSKVSVSDV